MTAPRTFNLTALAERLLAERRLLPLAGKIQRSRDLHSLRTDLVMAIESLDALDALVSAPRDLDDDTTLITESALLNNAIILYVRATKTTSDERRGFDIRSRFDEQQRTVHQELCDLRDAAIAHFGSGGSYAGEWQGELAILHFRGNEAKPAVVTRRQTLDKSLAKRARTQVEAAHSILCDIYMALQDDVTKELDAAAKAVPEFFREIQQHPLNLDLFMKSPAAAHSVRDSFDGGYAKGAVEHR